MHIINIVFHRKTCNLVLKMAKTLGFVQSFPQFLYLSVEIMSSELWLNLVNSHGCIGVKICCGSLVCNGKFVVALRCYHNSIVAAK